jgi:isomaltose glucohydrolase
MTTPQAESSPAGLARLARESADLVVALQDPSGAYPASPTFSAYRG